MQDTVKVRINAKIVEEWRERGLTEGYEPFPATPGFYEFTRDEAKAYIRFMQDDLKNYFWEGGWQEYGDLIAATKRQIANFEKALAA